MCSPAKALAWTALTLCLLGVAPAAAQRDEAATTSPGHAAFVEGLELAEADRWAEAEERFRLAYRLTRSPAALLQRGLALRALGRVDEAERCLARLAGDLEAPDPLRRAARRARVALQRTTATVRLLGLAPVRHSVTLDDLPVEDDGSRPLTLRATEGRHRIAIELPRHRAETWTGTLQPGEARVVPMDLRPGLVEPEPAGSIVEEPWFWIIAGSVAVLVASAVVTTVIVVDANQSESTATETVRF